MAVDIRTVDVGSFDTMDEQADTFLQEEENACSSTTFKGMTRAFAFPRSIQYLCKERRVAFYLV